MTIEQKLWQLVKRLLEKTIEGSISWEATPRGNNYQTAFPKFSVRIGEIRPSGQEAPDYVITVYDEDGLEIERASDVELRNSVEELKISGDAFRTMSDLYSRARRAALGVDEALDHLLSSLDES